MMLEDLEILVKMTDRDNRHAGSFGVTSQAA
jgi:hypothetical protein